MLASDHRRWRLFVLQSNLPSMPNVARPHFLQPFRGLHSSDPHQASPHYLGGRCGILTPFLPRGDHHYNQSVPETEVVRELLNVPSPGLETGSTAREPPKAAPHHPAALSQLDCSCSSSRAFPSSCRVTLIRACPLWFSSLFGLKDGSGLLTLESSRIPPFLPAVKLCVLFLGEGAGGSGISSLVIHSG